MFSETVLIPCYVWICGSVYFKFFERGGLRMLFQEKPTTSHNSLCCVVVAETKIALWFDAKASFGIQEKVVSSQNSLWWCVSVAMGCFVSWKLHYGSAHKKLLTEAATSHISLWWCVDVVVHHKLKSALWVPLLQRPTILCGDVWL